MALGYEQLKKDFQDAADEKEKAEAAAAAPVEKPAGAEKDDDGEAD